MIIRYFAWIRERLNRDQQELELPGNVKTVQDLLHHMRTIDDDFAAIIPPETVFRAALDDELVEPDAPLDGAKELSIFPPMTGG